MWAGAMIGGLGANGWNTSAQTAALEGGQRHLTFHAFILCVVVGAIVGLVLGALGTKRPPAPPA
jgi:hypothetical protein